jgi:thymidylate synthase
MVSYDEKYLNLLDDILTNGIYKSNRTGINTFSVFSREMRIDIGRGFPLLTTKKLHHKSIVHELLWFLKGETNIKYLQENDVRIWNEWANESGELGPVYGKQWRAWKTDERIPLNRVKHEDNGFMEYRVVVIDQIQNCIDLLLNDPDSRRIVVSAWNVAELNDMALMPCHNFFQFVTEPTNPNEYSTIAPKHKLHLKFNMRSTDVFLGLPFNIASYALLLEMMAYKVNMIPGELIWTGGDVHIYENHIKQVEEQLKRDPNKFEAPNVYFTCESDLPFEDWKYDHIKIDEYEAYPSIKAKVAV